MLNRKLLGANTIDWSLPAIGWTLTTSGWSTYESGAAGTGRSFSVNSPNLWATSRPSAGGTHTYGADQIWSGEDVLLAGGYEYTWDGFFTYLSNSGPTYPSSTDAYLYAYTDYAGTTGETLVDSITAGSAVSNGAFSRTVTLPTGTKAVKMRFTAGNISGNVTGVAFRDTGLTIN